MKLALALVIATVGVLTTATASDGADWSSYGYAQGCSHGFGAAPPQGSTFQNQNGSIGTAGCTFTAADSGGGYYALGNNWFLQIRRGRKVISYSSAKASPPCKDRLIRFRDRVKVWSQIGIEAGNYGGCSTGLPSIPGPPSPYSTPPRGPR